MAVVELALVAPVLVLLLLGIIELGWTFGQYLDVRHGAREAARLTAVNFQATPSSGEAQSAQIVRETCGRLANPAESTITLRLVGGRSSGDRVEVVVSQRLTGLTGMFDPFLPGDLTSAAPSRLERAATFNGTGEYTSTCPTS